MGRDYWEPGDMIYVLEGKRYGLTANCRTTCLGPINEPCQTTSNLQGKCYKLSEASNYQGKALPIDVTAKIKALAGQGLSTRKIAKSIGVSNVTVHRVIKRKLVTV